MAEEVLEVLQPYCENEMRLLKRISKSIFLRFREPIAMVDYDDFFSLANLTLWQAYSSYNPDVGISFDSFLRTCLKKKFATEIRNRHANKRLVNQFTVSFDVKKEDGEECSILEFLPSDFDTFEEAVKQQGDEQYQDKVQCYLSRLSKRQREILHLLMGGYAAREIQKTLRISAKEYADDLKIMRSYERVNILF